MRKIFLILIHSFLIALLLFILICAIKFLLISKQAVDSILKIL